MKPSFKEFLTVIEEGKGFCSGIKDPLIRKACKNLTKKSYKNRMYGAGFNMNLSGAPSGDVGDAGGDGGNPGGAE